MDRNVEIWICWFYVQFQSPIGEIYKEDRETEESDESKSFLHRLMICTSGIISDYVVSAVRSKLDMQIQPIRAILETR